MGGSKFRTKEVEGSKFRKEVIQIFRVQNRENNGRCVTPKILPETSGCL